MKPTPEEQLRSEQLWVVWTVAARISGMTPSQVPSTGRRSHCPLAARQRIASSWAPAPSTQVICSFSTPTV